MKPCLECGYEFADSIKMGFHECPQCKTRHKNFTAKEGDGWELAPIHSTPGRRDDNDVTYLKTGKHITMVETSKPERRSYGAKDDPTFVGSGLCGVCGQPVAEWNTSIYKADTGSSLITRSYTYQGPEPGAEVEIRYDRIVIKKEVTCRVCEKCSLTKGLRPYWDRGMKGSEENLGWGRPKGFNTKYTQGKRGRRV